jgi:UDPglucose--hexose-1-phosphate uridylyltransferase
MPERGEIRQDKATRQWVIYAPARRKRPKDFRSPVTQAAPLPGRSASCPFCPGNEGELPSVLFETKGPSGSWQTRVVPNKFPALDPRGKLARNKSGIFITMEGFGHHEVVIETPQHDRDLALMTADELMAVIETYHRRYTDLMRKDGVMMVIIFRNHGERAGTSLIHPHSQIIATGIVPNSIRWREEEAQRYYDEWGTCVFCDILEYELRDGARVIDQNGSFVTFVPFAAEVPFETWIMPRRHGADFEAITDHEKQDLAGSLLRILARLRASLQDPDYNFVLNTWARYRANEPQLHWYLQIRPRLMTPAGFEIGSGMSINPSIPEEDAAFLRSAP